MLPPESSNAGLSFDEGVRDLYTFGRGLLGRLGHGTETDQTAPQLVDAVIGKRPAEVAAGSALTVVIVEHGRVYVWGALGPEAEAANDAAKATANHGNGNGNGSGNGQGGEHPSGSSSSGTASGVPNIPTARLVTSMQGKAVQMAAASSSHVVLLTEACEVFVVSSLRDLQSPVLVPELLGKGVRVVSCGDGWTLALTDTNDVYSWGHGTHGQLGHGNWMGKQTPERITEFHGKPIVEVACGDSHAAAITESGELYTWGNGKNGRLGLADESDANRPRLVRSLLANAERIQAVACGASHTVALTENGQIYSWGWNHFGQLGHGDTVSPIPARYFEGAVVQSVSCGTSHTAVLTTTGAVFTWGCANHGVLGHGDWLRKLKPTEVLGLRGKGVSRISCGAQHTAVIAKHVWIPDEEVDVCIACKESFSFFRRKHHCRHCGRIFCYACSNHSVAIPRFGFHSPVRVCDMCFTMLDGREDA